MLNFKYATCVLLIEIFDMFVSNQLVYIYILYANKTHLYILLNAQDYIMPKYYYFDT